MLRSNSPSEEIEPELLAVSDDGVGDDMSDIDASD